MRTELSKINFEPDSLPYGFLLGMIHRHAPPVVMGVHVTEKHVSGVFWSVVGVWTALNIYGAALITNCLAVVYPAWMSYKCEEEREPPKKWLSYWITYSLFSVVESYPDVGNKMPFYHTIKLVILLWCMYPGRKNGAEIIYSYALRPALAAFDHFVDADRKRKPKSPSSNFNKSEDYGLRKSESRDPLKKSGSKDSLKKSGSKDSFKDGKFK